MILIHCLLFSYTTKRQTFDQSADVSLCTEKAWVVTFAFWNIDGALLSSPQLAFYSLSIWSCSKRQEAKEIERLSLSQLHSSFISFLVVEEC